MRFKFDCELYWVFDKRINDMSQKYQMDLGQLTDKVVEKLKDSGVNVRECQKTENNRGNYVTVKSNHPLKIVAHPSLYPGIDPDTNIGNGTKATVVVRTYAWTYQKREGVNLSLIECVVTDLREYHPDDSDIVEI